MYWASISTSNITSKSNTNRYKNPNTAIILNSKLNLVYGENLN